MRKRYQLSHHEHSKPAKSFITPKDLPKSAKHKKRRRSRVKTFLLLVLILLVGILGYLGYSSIKAADNILASNISVASLIKQNSLKQSDGVTNILILGKGGDSHAGGQLTDTIMLARLRQSDKKLALISVPRDLMVNVPGRGNVRINEAYTQGFNNEKTTSKKSDAGAQMSSQVIEKNLGVPVHYYMVVDFVGFKELVDALGGVTVNVEKALDDPYYPKDSIVNGKLIESEAYAPVHIKAGIQQMNGDTALKYSRSRETTSDFDRAKRQQQVIFAIKEKALSLGILSNPIKLNEVFQSLGNHIKTSFSASELGDLMGVAKDYNQSQVINKVIDNSENGLLVSSDAGFYHLEPKTGNFTQIQSFVKNVFNSDQEVANATVEVYNGTKTAGLAAALAEKLKGEGFDVTKIENSDKQYDKTTIYDGTSSSKLYTKLKGIIGKAEVLPLDDKSKIKVYLGQDYAN